MLFLMLPTDNWVSRWDVIELRNEIEFHGTADETFCQDWNAFCFHNLSNQLSDFNQEMFCVHKSIFHRCEP